MKLYIFQYYRKAFKTLPLCIIALSIRIISYPFLKFNVQYHYNKLFKHETQFEDFL